MDLELSDDQRSVLSLLHQGHDAFTGCCERGHYGARLRVLAPLRRRGLIDHRDQPIGAANRSSELHTAPPGRGLRLGMPDCSH